MAPETEEQHFAKLMGGKIRNKWPRGKFRFWFEYWLQKQKNNVLPK
jgi:hypothetical protein